MCVVKLGFTGAGRRCLKIVGKMEWLEGLWRGGLFGKKGVYLKLWL
jgi:hypothetical protein